MKCYNVLICEKNMQMGKIVVMDMMNKTLKYTDQIKLFSQILNCKYFQCTVSQAIDVNHVDVQNKHHIVYCRPYLQ